MFINPSELAQLHNNDPSMKALYIQFKKIGMTHAKVLANALKFNTTVTELTFTGNKIHRAGAKQLTELFEANTTLTTLTFWHNQIRTAGIEALAKGFKNNRTLTSISLMDNKVNHKGVIAFAEALKENTTLKDLDLAWNRIGNRGAVALARALESNTTLTYIALGDNKINFEGAAALARALKSNTTLSCIALGNNKINFEGAAAFAELLAFNTTLTSIDLGQNNIDVPSASLLAEALKTNTTLTSLELNDNNIADVGAVAFAKALKFNTSLKMLDLSNNQIGTYSAAAFIETLKINTTLTSIDLDGNNIDKALLDEIYCMVKRNSTISALKAAWTHPITAYSPQKIQTYLTELIKARCNSFVVDANEMITTLLALRFSNHENEAENTAAALTQLRKLIKSPANHLNYLPDTAYPKELFRLITANVDAKDVDDAKAQSQALRGLLHPFADEGLQREAMAEWIALLNNDFFANLSRNSREKNASDRLLILLCCQHPHQADLTRFALAAYARLKRQTEPTFDEAAVKMQNPTALITAFETLLNEECVIEPRSRDGLRMKYLEQISQAFIDAPEPSVHAFFQPGAVSKVRAEETALKHHF